MKLLVDSSCDLPDWLLEEYSIDVMPLIVANKEVEYLDKVDIKPKSLYDRIRRGEEFKTAQTPLGIILEKFSSYAEEKEEVIYLCFSSGLSSLYQTSLLAKNQIQLEYPDFSIDIIDSRAASVGIGVIAYEAAKAIESGASKDEVIDLIDFYINNMEHVFTVDDMNHLYKGGRIKKIEALAGTVLNVKPILNIDDQGNLIFLDKVRGRKKLVKKVREIISCKTKDNNLDGQTIGLVYGDDLELAEAFEEILYSEFRAREIIRSEMGAAIAVHSGPGIIGITFLKENYSKTGQKSKKML